MVDYLLGQGLSPDDYDAILASARHPHLEELLMTSIEQRPDTNRTNFLFMEALHEGNCEIVKNILETGLNVNKRQCGINKVDFLTYRIDPFLNNTHTDYCLQLPLRSAIYSQNTAMVELLLAANADLNKIERVDNRDDPPPFYRYTYPLFGSIQMQNIEMTRLLISNNANVNPTLGHRFQQTPLQAAVDTANMEIVELLLQNNADVNAQPAGVRGATALQLAAMHGYLNIALLLLEYGANVFAPAAKIDGRTAFEGAAQHGRIDMVGLLWNATCGKGFGEEQHKYAIEYAEMGGHFSVTQYIRELVESLKADPA